MPSSSVFTTHMSPGHGLPFGRRLHSKSVSRVSFFWSWPPLLDEPRDAEHPAVEARVVEEEMAVLGEPMPGFDREHGRRLPRGETKNHAPSRATNRAQLDWRRTRCPGRF